MPVKREVVIHCRSLAAKDGHSAGRARLRTMARPKTDDDATKNLRPEDETQRAKKGTKIGLLPKRDVLADFKKIARAKKSD
jgi:hypothetical protein